MVLPHLEVSFRPRKVRLATSPRARDWLLASVCSLLPFVLQRQNAVGLSGNRRIFLPHPPGSRKPPWPRPTTFCLQRNYSTQAGRSSLFRKCVVCRDVGRSRRHGRNSRRLKHFRCGLLTTQTTRLNAAGRQRGADTLSDAHRPGLATPDGARSAAPIGNRQNRHSLTSRKLPGVEILRGWADETCWHFDPSATASYILRWQDSERLGVRARRHRLAPHDPTTVIPYSHSSPQTVLRQIQVHHADDRATMEFDDGDRVAGDVRTVSARGRRRAPDPDSSG